MTLKFYTGVAKGLKLKVAKFFELIPMSVEVTWQKLVEPLWSSIMDRLKSCCESCNLFSKD